MFFEFCVLYIIVNWLAYILANKLLVKFVRKFSNYVVNNCYDDFVLIGTNYEKRFLSN